MLQVPLPVSIRFPQTRVTFGSSVRPFNRETRLLAPNQLRTYGDRTAVTKTMLRGDFDKRPITDLELDELLGSVQTLPPAAWLPVNRE